MADRNVNVRVAFIREDAFIQDMELKFSPARVTKVFPRSHETFPAVVIPRFKAHCTLLVLGDQLNQSAGVASPER